MGVARLSATEVVAKAQAIHDKMEGNAAYPSPIPALPGFQANINALAAANAAVDANGGKAEHQAKREALKVVKLDIKTLMGYVQAVSNGDANVILSSGFDVVKRGGPIGELDRPQDLSARSTSVTGRVSMTWKREDGADMHHVYMSTSSDPFKWELIGATTKSRFNAEGLESGVQYWFAVTAIGAAGETSKSDVLLARAA